MLASRALSGNVCIVDLELRDFFFYDRLDVQIDRGDYDISVFRRLDRLFKIVVRIQIAVLSAVYPI